MEPFLIGICSGVVASVIFFLCNLLIRPHIKISKDVTISTAHEDKTKNIIRIKLVNHNRVRLVDVKYVLMKYTYYEDGNCEVEEIHPYKDPMQVIEAYSRKNTDYAVRISYVVDPNLFKVQGKATKVNLIFTVQAKHPISNTLAIKARTYEESNCKRGLFPNGKNTEITQDHTAEH